VNQVLKEIINMPDQQESKNNPGTVEIRDLEKKDNIIMS